MSVLDDIASVRKQESAKPLTKSTLVDGVVQESPSELSRKAGANIDVYSLARCLMSEGYGGPSSGYTMALAAIGQTIVNEATRRNLSLTKLLTTKEGKYGSQRKVGYAASSKDPTRYHLMIAQAVINGDVDDLVNNATKFLDPSVWARGATQEGKSLKPLPTILEDWGKTHAWVGPITGLDDFYLAFFRRETDAEKRKKSMDGLLAIFNARKTIMKGPGGSSRNLVATSEPTGNFPTGGVLMAALTIPIGLFLLQRLGR